MLVDSARCRYSQNYDYTYILAISPVDRSPIPDFPGTSVSQHKINIKSGEVEERVVHQALGGWRGYWKVTDEGRRIHKNRKDNQKIM